ncbi:hypothetical protein Cgig2_032320 [Carnegiea gigantea]|uniref:Uncharacterized protein n=1 Tax=Carnegiea gigantea TaxID=171969 RepID=A0A9Q1QIQ8_9CARY|nr:hypothetical protein Cgig2_032320 [Carnegiea gigantea]
MAPFRLRAPERICHTRTIGGGAKASAGGSDLRGVRKDEGNQASAQAHLRPTQGGDVSRIIKAKQALKKANNSIAASRSVITPYASKSHGVGWYEEQEESFCPRYSAGEGSEKRVPLPTRRMGRIPTGAPAPNSTHPPSKRPVLRGDKSEGYHLGIHPHEDQGNPMLRCLKPIETVAKLRNENQYCEYYKDYKHITSECCELKKALYELAYQG